MAVNIVTDEMRAAVHDEDCARRGHDIAVDNALVVDETRVRPVVGSKDPAQMPHLCCRHCGRVWLILEDVGRDYADAVAKLEGRLVVPARLRVRSDRTTAKRSTS